MIRSWVRIWAHLKHLLLCLLHVTELVGECRFEEAMCGGVLSSLRESCRSTHRSTIGGVLLVGVCIVKPSSATQAMEGGSGLLSWSAPAKRQLPAPSPTKWRAP